MNTMIGDEDRIQIGEFAKLAQTNLRTLRYYDELGLLSPVARSEGGFRFYARNQLERLAAIKRLQDLGLSLKEIVAAIAEDRTDPADGVAAGLRPAVERQIGLTEARLTELHGHLEALLIARRRLINLCEDCKHQLHPQGCDPCPRDGKPLPAMLKALLS